MKRGLALLLSLLLALSLTACGGSGGSGSGPADSGAGSSAPSESDSASPAISPIKVVATQGHASVHPYTTTFFGPILEYVSEATDGAFTYDHFTDGELVPMGGEYDALKQGQADVAFSLSVLYDPATFPLCAVTMLPTTVQTAAQGTAAIRAMMNSDVELKDGKTWYDLMFTDNGLVAWPSPAYTGQAICLKAGITVDSPDDFAGLRLRSNSSATEVYCKQLGATPVSMTAAESSDAMSRNALDGIVFCYDWTTYSFAELLGDVLNVSQGAAGTTNWVAVTTETWESWPQEVRDAFQEGWEAAMVTGCAALEASEQANVDYIYSIGGRMVEIADMPQDLQDHIAKATVNTWYDWIDQLEGQNQPGLATAILWRDCLIEAGATVPEQLMSLESYVPNA